MTESRFADACAAKRRFDLLVLRLKDSPAGTVAERELIHPLTRDVFPELRTTMDLPETTTRLANAIDRMTDWRETHTAGSIPDDIWDSMFSGSQEVHAELLRWERVYPQAYREAYLGDVSEAGTDGDGS